MGVITVYFLMALTTALTAMYELFNPVLHQLSIEKESDMLVERPWLSKLTLFGLGLLFAPALLPVVLIPSWGERFRAALLNSFRKPA